MKRKQLVAGVACGLLCVVCVLAYAASVQSEAENARNEAVSRYGGDQVDVVVAKTDILPGQTVEPSNAEVRSWLVDLLPEGAVSSMDEARGRQAASFVAKGEVLVEKRFQSDAASVDVPEGLVALSVPAEDVSAVGGAVQAGSRVDVFAVGAKTTRIGKDVLVLATNGGDEAGAKAKIEWMTLALEPAKVQEYVAAAESMELYFALPAATSADSGAPTDKEPAAKDADSAASAGQGGSNAARGEAR